MEYGSFYVLFNPERQKFLTKAGGYTTSISMTEHFATFEEASKKAEEFSDGCIVKEAVIILKD